VLASVQRVRMDRPLPVVQHMASLVSLRVGPGPLESVARLLQLGDVQADGISSRRGLSAIMQLTRLQELVLRIRQEDGADDGNLRLALDGIPCLRSLRSLDIDFPEMQRLPGSISHLPALSSLELRSCSSLQQLPNTIGQLTALTSLHLRDCGSLQELPNTIGQLTALTSLHLDVCSSLQQLPDTIGQPFASWTYATAAACSSCPTPSASWQPSPAWTWAAAPACNSCQTLSAS
jgi:hypothetical protein